MIFVLDEIYYDLVMFGVFWYMVIVLVVLEIESCLVMLMVVIKIFNIVGVYIGNIIVFDFELCGVMVQKLVVLGILLGFFGLYMVVVVYLLEGVVWVDELVVYLDGNCWDFDKVVNVILGLCLMLL